MCQSIACKDCDRDTFLSVAVSLDKIHWSIRPLQGPFLIFGCTGTIFSDRCPHTYLKTRMWATLLDYISSLGRRVFSLWNFLSCEFYNCFWYQFNLKESTVMTDFGLMLTHQSPKQLPAKLTPTLFLESETSLAAKSVWEQSSSSHTDVTCFCYFHQYFSILDLWSIKFKSTGVWILRV